MVNINIGKYENLISHVFIDDRENVRKDFALKQYASLNPSIKHLDIGDYIFKNSDGLEVVFEYKTGSDFLSSINSETHHLENQVYNMVTNFDYAFVIVECVDLMHELDEFYFSTGINMSLSQINGAIAEFTVNSTVLFVQTQYQAFDLMMRVAGKIFMNKPLRYKYGKKSTNAALNYLSAIKGLDSKAQDICRTLDLKTLQDLHDLSLEDLELVDGIGKKTAAKIINELK
jgi:ERCC4-type nuclease